MTRLYNEIGIRQLCEQKINTYFEESLKCLESIPLPAERKEELRLYVLEMMKREK